VLVKPKGGFKGILYNVYGDESHDGKASIIYVVSGLFGDDAAWDAATSAWTATAITNGEEFHASEWSSRSKYSSLCRVICKSKLIAFAAGMDLSEYKTLFPNPVDQLPYYFCFYKVVEHMADIASSCIPREELRFTFDRNLEVKYNAAYLYDSLIKVPEFKHWELLADKIVFSARNDPHMQIADMVARESMNWLKAVVIGNAAPRSSCLADLVDSHRLHWHHFHRDYFVQRVAHIQRLVDQGHPMGNFEHWRRERNCQDTAENRMRYQIEIDKKLRAQGITPL
jgi:hypothetical protein